MAIRTFSKRNSFNYHCPNFFALDRRLLAIKKKKEIEEREKQTNKQRRRASIVRFDFIYFCSSFSCFFNYFSSSYLVLYLQKLQTIGEDFCGLDVNTPLGGEDPIAAFPVLTFDTLLTAVAATSTGDYTVVFLGTNKGHLKKVKYFGYLT